jgi:hypothetical protein
MNNSIKLIVSPLEDFPGIFEAKVNDELIAKSRQPFLDSARKLIEAGSDPESTLTMYHKGSDTLALKSKLSSAAKITVNEDGPKFRKFEPFTGITKKKAEP